MKVDSKHPQKEVYFPVRTIPLYDNVLEVCERRGQDKWAVKVAARLKRCSDQISAEAVYHKHCYNRFHFRTGKDLTGRESVQDPTTARGAHRPPDETKLISFNAMCKWLESQMDRCLYSVSELREQLLVSDFKENDVYSVKTLKRKIRRILQRPCCVC